MRIITKTTILFLLIQLIIDVCRGYEITILTNQGQINVTNENGEIRQDFASDSSRLSCAMPKLYIYNDTAHNYYEIQSQGILIESILGKYNTVNSSIKCSQDDLNRCVAVLNSGCSDKNRYQMNKVIVNLRSPTNQYNRFQYLVNCQPQQFYKPFQWGLFILICLSTITITASSFYSQAWSYKGYGINITRNFNILFNIMIVLASVLAYLVPIITSVALKVIGSIIGTIGVAICTSQTLWLAKKNFLNSPRLGPIRLLDVISVINGLFAIMLYWLLPQVWIINDFLAMCTIISAIKIFKIRSFKMGIIMLYTLLIIQILGGLIVHYILKVSYNNLVIQMFQSPLVLVFPSITPQLYRKCAWIPVTNIIFPGLFISYLRRFDKSRGTCLYLLIGYVSFYIGSILWMIVDMETRHALPMAIISDPFTTIIIGYFAMRRNQLKTLWNGLFYDVEMPDISEIIMPPNKSDNYIAFQQITEDLKIDKNRNSNINAQSKIGQI